MNYLLPWDDTTIIRDTLYARNEPVYIHGCGASSILRADFSNRAMIRAEFSAHYRGTVLIRDCTLESAGPFNPTQHAVECLWDDPASSIFDPEVILDNVVIRGYGLVSGLGFGRGVWLHNCWFTEMNQVSMAGNLGTSHPLYVPGTRLATIDGRGAGYNFTSCRGTNLESLIDASGDVQGITATNIMALLCRYGVVARGNGTGPVAVDEPQLDIQQSHFNTLERAVVVHGMAQSRVAGCNMYANENADPATPWFGLDVQAGSDGLKAIGNTFVKNNRSYCTGIAYAANNFVGGHNVFQGADRGVWGTGRDARLGPDRIEGGGRLYDVAPGLGTQYVSLSDHP